MPSQIGRRARVYRSMSGPQQAEAQRATEYGKPGPWATHEPPRTALSPGRARLCGAGPAAASERVYGSAPDPKAVVSARSQGQQERRDRHEGGPRTGDGALMPSGGSQGNAGYIRGAPSDGQPYGGGRHDGVTAVPQPSDGTGGHRDYTTRNRLGNAVMANSSTTVYERHMMLKTGTERQAAHTDDDTGGEGRNPLSDGPVRPVSNYQVNRVLYPRIGNTGTRHLDNPGPFAVTASTDGRAQPLGIQDGSPWSKVYGGTPGLTHIYGVRGTAGVVAPAEPGQPGDGPQKIRGGMPHGLHSHAQPSAATRLSRMTATPQQRRSRRSLPANAARSGQAWSQNVPHLTEAGRAVPVPRTAGRLPGVAGQRTGRSG